jgi:rhodanese-related sulfurtransferase
VFAYKAAVAVKAHGYQNIKIYNGGIKDWIKSGHQTESIEPLPEYEGQFVTVEELFKIISRGAAEDCLDKAGNAILTILDLRTEHHLEQVERPLIVKTNCRTIFSLMDDLRKKEVREQIPKKGFIVTITETGNRDKYVMQYLHRFGYANVKALLYGMRAWIKAGYPVETASGIPSK